MELYIKHDGKNTANSKFYTLHKKEKSFNASEIEIFR